MILAIAGSTASSWRNGFQLIRIPRIRSARMVRLACPPEDCGGIPGFYDLVEALNDPNHERHEEMLDWIGDDFDPQAFSVDKVNRMLAHLGRHRKTSQS